MQNDTEKKVDTEKKADTENKTDTETKNSYSHLTTTFYIYLKLFTLIIQST